MKKKFLLIIIISLTIISTGCTNVKQAQPGKIKIVTTLFPLYDFAKNIGGDKIEVSLLLPPGVEAHSFDPKPSDIVKINQADLFVFTGKFMEPWVDDILKGINNKSLKVVDASDGIRMFAQMQADLSEKNNGVDPHVWLDFDNAKIIVNNIAKNLAEKDAISADFYQKKSQKYNEELTKLNNVYQSSLANCQNREIIYGGHYAFGYLARKYDLRYIAAQGFSPDSEPTANDLIALIEQIKKNNIKYIFYEELSSPKIAETLANETNAKMLFLNAAHNITKEDFANNISFISIMEDNLKNLQVGLQCNN